MALTNISLVHYDDYEAIEPFKTICQKFKDRIYDAHGYFEAKGIKNIREQISTFYDLQNSDDVMIVHSVSHAFWAIINALCEDGDSYLLPKFYTLEMTVCPHERNITFLQYENITDIPSIIKPNIKCIVLANPCVLTGKFLKESDVTNIISAITCPLIIYSHSQYFKFKKESNILEIIRKQNIPAFIVEGAGGRYGLAGLSIGWIGYLCANNELESIKKAITCMHSFFLHASTLSQVQIPLLEESFKIYSSELQQSLLIKKERLQKEIQNLGFIPIEPDSGTSYTIQCNTKENFEMLKAYCKSTNKYYEALNEIYLKVYY